MSNTVLNPFAGKLQMIGVISNPPVNCKKVVNIYVDADGKLAVDYEV